MTITSYGYRGTIDEVQWARMAPHISAARYGVVGIDDCAVTAVAGADRTLEVAPGRAWGQGVMDELNHNPEPLRVQLPAVASGSRWDLIALRRSWLETPGKTSLVSVQGTSTKAIPANRLAAAGDVDDQPLALVRIVAGQSAPAEIVDLRCWAESGGVQVLTDLAMQYLAFPGSMVWLDYQTYTFSRGTNNGSPWGWVKTSSIGMRHGHQQLFSGWAARGTITSTNEPPRRINNADIAVERTGATFTLSAGGWTNLGVILFDVTKATKTPPTGTAWQHFPAIVTRADDTPQLIAVAWNKVDGALRIRAIQGMGTTTIRTGASISLIPTWTTTD